MSTSICTCKGKLRFELEGLHELFALLHFPQIVKLHNCTCTGEEILLYMLRRLSYRLRSSWHYTTLGGWQAVVRHPAQGGKYASSCGNHEVPDE
jgi:hypothetical protein